jgi:GntR family transcriptional regulator
MNGLVPGRVAEIRARLLSLVDELPEGSMLPPERDLADRWGVARMTLRRAMGELVEDGLLVKRQGSGTYTTRPKIARRLVMASFTEEMQRRGLTATSRTVDLRRRRADHHLSRTLRIPAGDLVLSIVRLRLADGVPMALERTSIPDRYVPGLTLDDLAGSLYDVLAGRYGVELIAGQSTLEAAMPDARSAVLLEIPETQPCLARHGISLDARGRVLEHAFALYRGDRFSMTIDLHRPRAVAEPSLRQSG